MLKRLRKLLILHHAQVFGKYITISFFFFFSDPTSLTGGNKVTIEDAFAFINLGVYYLGGPP